MLPPLDPETFLHHFVSAADTAGFKVVEYGLAGTFPLLAAERRPTGTPCMSIYLSAGIHGNEPAGPLALLSLTAQGWFDPGIAWHVLPLLNPRGMAAGTRESPDGIDLNRDYREERAGETRAHRKWLARTAWRYDAALSLHEDWEASGFYLYEMHEPGMPRPGVAILQAVEPLTGLDHSTVIDGFPARNGLLRPHADVSLETVAQWPEQLHLRAHHTTLSLTFETPTALPLELRARAQTVAVKTAVNQLLMPRMENTYEI